MRARSAARRSFVVLSLIAATVALGPPAGATTFKVTNVLDGGPGSLRQAILDANAHRGRDQIVFSIGSGPKTIVPAVQLPAITGPVDIDGRTQPGFPGTPLITLDGAGVITEGLPISGASSTIRSLVIVNFATGTNDGVAVHITGSRNRLFGNYIGIDTAGAAHANDSGVIIDGGGGRTSIGGSGAGARNVVSGNLGDAISITDGARNSIQNNFIGVGPTGSAAVPNGTGIEVQSSRGNRIGGGGAARRNIISGNFRGIGLGDADANVIAGNYLGLDVAGTSGIPNTEVSIEIIDGSDRNRIGGPRPTDRNVIAGGTDDGIDLEGSPGSTGNAILGNFIGTDVTGTAAFGIGESAINLAQEASGNIIRGNLLANSGAGVLLEETVANNHIDANRMIGNNRGLSVTGAGRNLITRNVITTNAQEGILIDGTSSALGLTISRNSINDNAGVGISLINGGNGLEPAPVITAVTRRRGRTIFTGTIGAGRHRIEVFLNDACDGSGFGEGKQFVGAVTTTATTWRVIVGRVFNGTPKFSATSTDVTTGNTSQFAACF